MSLPPVLTVHTAGVTRRSRGHLLCPDLEVESLPPASALLSFLSVTVASYAVAPMSLSGSDPPTLNITSPPFSAAIQNSLVGGPILQNVLGTVTSVNQGLLGSGGLLGGGGLLSYGGIFGVVEELSG